LDVHTLFGGCSQEISRRIIAAAMEASGEADRREGELNAKLLLHCLAKRANSQLGVMF
jgi:hypothetical protein